MLRLKPSLRLRTSNANLGSNPFNTVSTASTTNTIFAPLNSSTATPTLDSPVSSRSAHTDVDLGTMDSSHTSPDAIGIHRGAIDNTTITTRPPKETMTKVKNVLDSIGICVQPESTFKFRCIRPSQSSSGSETSVEGIRPKVMDTSISTIYAADPSRDPGGEVIFSVELTRLAGLNDTYSLDIRRLKGNLRSYQFLYEAIRDRAQLST